MAKRRDLALECAREILNHTICECGHTDSEHAGHRETVYSPPDGECHGGDDCSCAQFKAVAFVVRRA